MALQSLAKLMHILQTYIKNTYTASLVFDMNKTETFQLYIMLLSFNKSALSFFPTFLPRYFSDSSAGGTASSGAVCCAAYEHPAGAEVPASDQSGRGLLVEDPV